MNKVIRHKALFTGPTLDTLNSIMGLSNLDLMSFGFMSSAIQFTITNIANGKMFSSPSQTLETFVGATLFHTTKSIFSNKLTMGITNTFGITSKFAGLLIGNIISSVITEFVEVQMGLDISFGFGGQSVGKDKFGNHHYTASRSYIGGIYDTIAGKFGQYTQTEFNELSAKADLSRANSQFDQLQNVSDIYASGYSESLGASSFSGVGEIGVSTFGTFSALVRGYELNNINELSSVSKNNGWESFDDAYAGYFGEFENDVDGDGIDDSL